MRIPSSLVRPSTMPVPGEALLSQQAGGVMDTLGPEKILEGVLVCENPMIVERAERMEGGLHRAERA